jgi:PAS domain S-box-containing protein
MQEVGRTQLAKPTFTSTGPGALVGSIAWRILPMVGHTPKLSSVQSDSYLIVAGTGFGHVDWLADADVTVTGYQVYRTTGTGKLFYLEGYVNGRLTVRFNVGGATDTDALLIGGRELHEFSAGRVPSEGLSNEVWGHDTLDDLRATIDLAPIGMAQFDFDGRFLYLNGRLCEILGCDRADIINRTFQELTFPDDLPRCLELTARLAANEIPQYQLQKRFVSPGGAVVWARITVSAVRRADGAVKFFIGAAEDISEQVAAEEARRTAEERARTALDASKIGTFRFDVRRNALDWSDGLERVFGGAESVTLDQFFAVMHPDDRSHVMAAYTRSVTEGVDLEEEFRVFWPDGSMHWLHDRGRTLPGTDGKPHQIIGAITDITNHRRMEQIISERDAQFRTLADTIPQLAWIANNDGTRVWFNERWFAYTGESLASSRDLGWMGIHEGDKGAAVLARQQAAFRLGAVWEETVRLRGKDGEYRWFLSRAMPVRDAHGTITQWFGTNTDVTDAWAARDEAERATKARDEIIAVLAHDLRNPMQAILGAAAMLRVTVEDEKRQRQVAMIQRATQAMERLVTDLLDMARIDSGAFVIETKPVDVAAVISQVIDLCESQAAARNVALKAEVTDALPGIEADPGRLLQLLSNLLGNAMKFSPPNTAVVVRAAASSRGVEVSVADSGVGIPAEDLPRIFDRFWQGGGQSRAGVGLGLAICKGIIDAHDGRIWATSEVGRGTTFYFEIPQPHGVNTSLHR